MEKLITKAVQIGLGIADLTREEVEKFVDEFSKKNKSNTKEGRKLVDRLIKDGEAAKKKLEEKVEEKVKSALKKMPVATKADIERLEKKIDAFKKKR